MIQNQKILYDFSLAYSYHLNDMQNSNKRIRVLQLASPSGLYGAERWILALIKHLDDKKIQSIVAVIQDAPDFNPPICREANVAGFETHVFEAYGKINFSAVRQLRDFIQINNIHILHTHGYKTDIIGRLATIGTACKIISTPHGWSRNAGIKLWFYEIVDRLFFIFFDAVVPLSDDIYKGLKSIPGLNRKLYMISNGVDISEIDAMHEIADEIKIWKNDGNFIFGYIGQLIPRKGLPVLLNAFAKLDIPKKKLAILGEGNQRANLEKITIQLGINEHVNFFGFRENRIVFLKGFDVFVLPSRLEGIPRCLMEAMASGVPVISTNIPGCRDLVDDGKTGLLFNLDSTDSLLECLIKILNEKTRLSLTSNAYELIRMKYSAMNMANKYLALYEKLTK